MRPGRQIKIILGTTGIVCEDGLTFVFSLKHLSNSLSSAQGAATMKGATIARQPCYPLPHIALMDRRGCIRLVLRSLVRSRTSGFASHPFEWFAFIKQFFLKERNVIFIQSKLDAKHRVLFLIVLIVLNYYKYKHRYFFMVILMVSFCSNSMVFQLQDGN